MGRKDNILRTSFDEFDRETLIDIIIEQARRLKRQAQLIEEAQRAAKRPAAPFRKDPKKRKTNPKPPGRKGGHQGYFRPVPDHIDQHLEAPLSGCPHCHGPINDPRPVRQFIEEIPPARKLVTEVVTYRGHCPDCGPVASSHPMQQASPKGRRATGAAAVQLGPRAQALAAELVFDLGLTRRKACRLLRQRFGLKITPGGLQHLAHRLADRLRPRYARLSAALRQAAVVHADETSWYLGTPGGEPRAWLWVFCHAESTIYRVERSRARRVITDTLGSDFPGVLVSDCLNIYDDATPVQHKCYAHHLKAIKQQVKLAASVGLSTLWLDRARSLLLGAMALWRAGPDLPAGAYAGYVSQLERSADELLSSVGVSPMDASIRNRLVKQRDHLFTFLYHREVEATNNLAERQLRPAVVTRKVMCGNRSARGASTWSVLSSLSATARQRGSTLAEWIVADLRGTPIVALER